MINHKMEKQILQDLFDFYGVSLRSLDELGILKYLISLSVFFFAFLIHLFGRIVLVLMICIFIYVFTLPSEGQSLIRIFEDWLFNKTALFFASAIILLDRYYETMIEPYRKGIIECVSKREIFHNYLDCLKKICGRKAWKVVLFTSPLAFILAVNLNIMILDSPMIKGILNSEQNKEANVKLHEIDRFFQKIRTGNNELTIYKNYKIIVNSKNGKKALYLYASSFFVAFWFCSFVLFQLFYMSGFKRNIYSQYYNHLVKYLK